MRAACASGADGNLQRMLSTRARILLARAVAAPVLVARRLVGRGAETDVPRRRIQGRLDLREEIDLAIWLSGRFEGSTVRAYGKLVRPANTLRQGPHILMELARPTSSTRRARASKSWLRSSGLRITRSRSLDRAEASGSKERRSARSCRPAARSTSWRHERRPEPEPLAPPSDSIATFDFTGRSVRAPRSNASR